MEGAPALGEEGVAVQAHGPNTSSFPSSIHPDFKLATGMRTGSKFLCQQLECQDLKMEVRAILSASYEAYCVKTLLLGRHLVPVAQWARPLC